MVLFRTNRMKGQEGTMNTEPSCNVMGQQAEMEGGGDRQTPGSSLTVQSNTLDQFPNQRESHSQTKRGMTPMVFLYLHMFTSAPTPTQPPTHNHAHIQSYTHATMHTHNHLHTTMHTHK